MVVAHFCEEAEFIRPSSSRDNHRHSCARAHGRRSAAHQEAIAEERKQRSRSKTRKQQIRSKTRNNDRRDKWEEVHTLEVPEEIPDSLPPLIDSMVEVARFSDEVPKSFEDARRENLRLEALYQYYLQEWDWREWEEKRRGRNGRWLLVVNPAARMAALLRYQSRDGCETCDNFLIESDDGVSGALEPTLNQLPAPVSSHNDDLDEAERLAEEIIAQLLQK